MNTLKNKLSYLWDYYKAPIIGIPLAILLFAYVFSTLNGSKELPFSVYFINQELTIEDGEALEAQLQAEPALSSLTEQVYVDTSLRITPENPDFDSQMSFTASISGHTIDIMISDRSFLEYYAKMDALADLSQLLPADLYEQLSPHLLLAENKEGLMTPYALDLSNCTYFSVLNLSEPVLTIAKYSEHPQACTEFLRLVFSE